MRCTLKVMNTTCVIQKLSRKKNTNENSITKTSIVQKLNMIIFSLHSGFRIFYRICPHDGISRLMKVMPIENDSIKTFENAEDVCMYDE